MPTEHRTESLKEIREARGYTTDYVARMTDIPPRVLEAFECGTETPSEEQLLLLSRLYETDLTSLSETEADPSTEDAPCDTEDSDTPPDAFDVPSSAARVFQKALEDGERILWYGCPYMKRTASNLMVRGFGTVLILVFYFMWSLKEIQSGKLRLPTILLHALLITGVSFGFELFSILRNKRIRYAVTDRRVLILCGFFRQTVVEYRYEGNASPKLWKTTSNRGIIFMTEDAYRYTVGEDSRYAGARRASPDVRTAFVDIIDAERVYSLLTHALRAHRRADRDDENKAG